jgi:hypothetical protein
VFTWNVRLFIYLFSKFIPRAVYQHRSIKNVRHFLTFLFHRISGVTPSKGYYLWQPLWSYISSNIPISPSWKTGEPIVRSIVRATTSRTEIDCDIIYFLSMKAASRVVISYKRSFSVMTTRRIEEDALGTHVGRLVTWNLGRWMCSRWCFAGWLLIECLWCLLISCWLCLL